MGAKSVVGEVQCILYHPGDAPPSDGATDFFVSAQVLVGVAGEDLADSFDLMVFSPQRYAAYIGSEWDARVDDELLPGGAIRPVTGVWLMQSWSTDAFDSAVRRIVVASGPAPDWITLAQRISRLMPWEYDYEVDRRINEQAGLPDLALNTWHDG
ncbi:hypothetical protein KEM60_01068 [Austwickia sp. TVS 96-490-7B]|uniref:Imm8 family immunity protein n=1 Tax=Austwickia sp. TVS 96-490-7B TaxID=2830843 RepID=UPI001C56A62D|nr:Imm8 family immunity protein [Austwickia sp. TVS 96-490-7B]MBW3084879.1 hypothetical protein [Austwickia sp. TVS 96-490-7B]